MEITIKLELGHPINLAITDFFKEYFDQNKETMLSRIKIDTTVISKIFTENFKQYIKDLDFEYVFSDFPDAISDSIGNQVIQIMEEQFASKLKTPKS
jgi:hypothetical protein